MRHCPITVVIPVYNRAHTLPRLMESIDRQTVRPSEVIMVNNNSTDNSEELILDWARRNHSVCYDNCTTPGASAARNVGLKNVCSSWTMFFDSDDVMHPHHIEYYFEALQWHPCADIVGKDIVHLYDNGRSRRCYYSTHAPLFSHLFRTTLSTQRYIAPTELFRKVGGWNESLPVWNDLELGVRLLLTNPSLGRAGGPPSAFVHHSDLSITGPDFISKKGLWENTLDVIREHLVEASSPHSHMLDWLDARTLILAADYAREGAHEQAAKLHDTVLNRTSHPRKMELIYRHNITFGRLTWPLVKLLFP